MTAVDGRIDFRDKIFCFPLNHITVCCGFPQHSDFSSSIWLGSQVDLSLALLESRQRIILVSLINYASIVRCN
jgi:hypothetical protein